jgi:hypothetical protein
MVIFVLATAEISDFTKTCKTKCSGHVDVRNVAMRSIKRIKVKKKLLQDNRKTVVSCINFRHNSGD